MLASLLCGVAYVLTLALGNPQSGLAWACFIFTIWMIVRIADESAPERKT